MLAIRDIAEGARIELVDGSRRVVVDNPRDGMWLVTGPEDPDAPDEGEPMVFATDVARVLDQE